MHVSFKNVESSKYDITTQKHYLWDLLVSYISYIFQKTKYLCHRYRCVQYKTHTSHLPISHTQLTAFTLQSFTSIASTVQNSCGSAYSDGRGGRPGLAIFTVLSDRPKLIHTQHCQAINSMASLFGNKDAASIRITLTGAVSHYPSTQSSSPRCVQTERQKP